MLESVAQKTVFIQTYGCQMNIYDSERIEETLGNVGFRSVDSYQNADLVIINTCHIREKASEKVYSELGRIKPFKDAKAAKGERMVIVIAGCVAQAEGEEVLRRAPFVDIVSGPESYHNLPDLVSSAMRGARAVTDLDFKPSEKFDFLPQERKTGGYSRFVTVQEGCDKFCTFCVVPYTRGAEFSRDVADVYNEVLQLVQKGAREVTLLGQNVNAYHGNDATGKESGLAYLIAKLSEIEDLWRIRYTTSHPINMTQDLIDEHGKNPKLMPYLHLPVQSGSNEILKKMNRKHTREEYFRIIDKLKASCPDIALSSDFIVGFPDESEKQFEETLDLIRVVGFAQSYSFKYSPRPGTPAALKSQIEEEVASERLARIQELLIMQQKSFNAGFNGKVLPILFENVGIRKDLHQVTGKSPYLQAVAMEISGGKCAEDFIGTVQNVKICEVKENSLVGKLEVV